MKKTIHFIAAFLLISGLSFGQNSWNMTMHDNWTASHAGAYYNDCWGYVDSNGREYAILGSNRATHFLDVTDPANIVHVGTFDGRNLNTTWRDFKVWEHYAFGVNDGGGGSLQIFDLQYMPDSVVKIYDHDSLGNSTHNIQMWRSDLYMIDNKGTDSNGQGFRWPIRVVSVEDPHNPKTVGGLFNTDYNLGHDIYIWHDTVYLSVYFSATKDGLHVFNFRAPKYPQLIGSLTNYPEAGINHSSWGTWDRKTLVMADETHGSGLKTVDITDPTNMTTLAVFRTFPGAIAHNPFIVDTLAFVAYYHDGLQVWSIADPSNPKHIAYYDTDTAHGGGSNYPGYLGCWGTYPFFPSGTLIASDVTNGLFTITLDGWTPPPPPPLPVGLDQQSIAEVGLNIYPNPSTGKVTISLDNSIDEVLKVELFNTNGNRVYHANVEGKFGIFDFDFSHIGTGLYMVRVHGEGFEKRNRIILK